MTTVVGLATEDGVWMAADSGTNVYDRPVGGAMKLLTLPLADEKTAVLGISGNAGMPAMVRRVWATDSNLPEADHLLDDWCAALATNLTVPMVEAGMTDPDGQLDGTFLLGLPATSNDGPTLWTLEHHMAIRMPDGRGAVGSGEGPAMGALDALLDASRLSPQFAVTRACGIAIERCRFSVGPVNTVFLAAGR
jgi:hypothetical protein